MTFIASELEGFFDEADLFEQVAGLPGEVVREVANRRTVRVELGESTYFAKIHHGVGWAEIFKNLLQARLPILGAANEWAALNRLRELGVDTMVPVLYSAEGANPAAQRSCIVTRALLDMVSLEDFVLTPAFDLAAKRKLLPKLAKISRILHDNGVNHRDYYICHFLMQDLTDEDAEGLPRLYLIDLHRAQIRDRTPDRWRAKDIGGLLYSSLECGLTRRDLMRFMKIYTGAAALRDVISDPFWHQVKKRARALYLQDHPALPPHVIRLLDEG